jgi:outer membrane protein assembly factor BamB
LLLGLLVAILFVAQARCPEEYGTRRDGMKIKRFLYSSVIVLIACVACVPGVVAQIPCGATVLTPPTLSANWPQFRFDAAHTGCNPYESVLNATTVGNLVLKWHAYIGLALQSTPTEANGVLYVGRPGPQGYVFAFNASTGQQLWGTIAGNDVYGTPAVANGMVYAGTSSGNLAALNATTGHLLWNYWTGAQIVAAPTVANGVVYVGSYDHYLHAVNASTGTLKWKYLIGTSIYAAATVANGVVYVGVPDHNVYALDAETGTLLWTFTTGNYVMNSPAVANGVVYVASDDLYVYALDARTGALLWKFGKLLGTPSTVSVSRGVVYFGGPNHLYALNGRTGAVVWDHFIANGAAGQNFEPVIANGLVYCQFPFDEQHQDQNGLYALDANTGATVWQYNDPEWLFDNSPLVVNGVVFAGDVYAFALPN